MIMNRVHDVTRLRKRLREPQAALNEMDHFLERDMALHREIATISGDPIFPAIAGTDGQTRSPCCLRRRLPPRV